MDELKLSKDVLQQITIAQKQVLEEHVKDYNANIRKIGLRAAKDQERYKIPTAEIAALAGMSPDAVSDFLRGKSVPHIVVVSAICGAILLLKPQYALKTVQNVKPRKK